MVWIQWESIACLWNNDFLKREVSQALLLKGEATCVIINPCLVPFLPPLPFSRPQSSIPQYSLANISFCVMPTCKQLVLP